MVTIKRIAITKVNTIVKYVLFAKIVLSCEFTFLLGWLTGPIIRIKMAQNAYSTKEINSGKDDVVVMKKNCLEDDIEKVKVILGKDEKSIFRLNETAKFIWDNCNGRRISEISTLLFDACVNKESLDIDVISEDCREIISMLLDNDLIEIKEV